MIGYEWSEHAEEMLKERDIQESWVDLALREPDGVEKREDGTMHYIKAVQEYGGRYLGVVVNPMVEPPRIVTLFFDRRLGRLT